MAFEEISTILCLTESHNYPRLLVPMCTDPQDLRALTSAHFVMSETLIHFPAVNMFPNRFLSPSCK